MSTVHISIHADSAAEALHELGKLIAQSAKDTSSSTTDHRYMHASDLQRISRDLHAKGYQAGLTDAKEEQALERKFSGNRSLDAMLEYDTVMLCPESGRAPFKFAPYGIMRYCDAELSITNSKIASHTVGIVGTNLVTMERAFYARVDHWTLCEPA